MKPIFSVSEFIDVMNQTLEYTYPGVEIEGEVASFKINQGKYVFFDLKDEESSISCFMTVWQLRVPIEDGMKILIKGVPKITRWGKFSVTISHITPSGEGALKKSFELLRAKLDKEGLFAPERKRRLPEIPSYIGIISSVQAAGYADFIKIINDRWGGVRVDVAHVQVQGSEAPDQIIAAIKYFNELDILPEVIIIIRGGGSADDLAAFNDEPLVRAIASSRIPTLVGVGHEVDESLCDLVADVRAATPSNAAQILVPDRNEIIKMANFKVQALLPRVQHYIDTLQELLRTKMYESINQISRRLDERICEVANIKRVIMQFDPNRVLSRGYALVRGKMLVGETIEVETIKVIMNAEVKNIHEK